MSDPRSAGPQSAGPRSPASWTADPWTADPQKPNRSEHGTARVTSPFPPPPHLRLIQALPAAVRFASAPSSGTFGSGALGAVAVRAVRTRKDCEVEDGSSLRSDFGSSQDLCAALFAVRSQACWSASSPAFLDDPRNVGPRAVEPRAVESSSKACQRGTSPAVQPSSRLWNSRRADEPTS